MRSDRRHGKVLENLRFGVVAGVLLALAAPAASEDMSKLDIPEQHTVEVLSKGDAHRLYVLDMSFAHAISGRVYIADGLKQKVLGTITAGYMPNIVVSPDHEELHVLGAFFERGARGNRTDVVVTYDARTLEPVREVILPAGRFLVADKAHNVDLTTDGRFLLSTNMNPATSVDIVDLENGRYVGAVETPGCLFAYPSGPKRFSSLCADGSLFTAEFDEDGGSVATRTEPFFDVIEDPLFVHAGFDRGRGRYHFLSHGGLVQTVDLSGEVPVFADTWSILTDEDRAKEWRAGGWQLLTFHAPSQRLFVLMHQGGDWTHKKPGQEVWVFDLVKKERVARIPMAKPAGSIAVTQAEDQVLIYAMSKNVFMTYDAETGKHIGTMDQMGATPLEIVVHNR